MVAVEIIFAHRQPVKKRREGLTKPSLAGPRTPDVSSGILSRNNPSKWLPTAYGYKNCNCQELPGTARRCQELTRSRPAHIQHEVPVALVRRAKGRCALVRREDAGDARPVTLRPWEGRSVIAVAQEAAEQLKAGMGEAALAVQMKLSRCKLRHLLGFLALPKVIKGQLLRTRDMEGRIGERQLRALLRLRDEKAMVLTFRRFVLRHQAACLLTRAKAP